MHLLLVSNYPLDGQWSMKIYADLVEEVAEQAGWRVTRIAPIERVAAGRNTGSGLGKWLGYVDKYILAPRSFRRTLRELRIRGDLPDLVHITDHSNAIYIGCFPGLQILVTCHDVIAIRKARGEFAFGRTSWTGRLQQKWILSWLRRANHFIFDSAASERDLSRLLTKDLSKEPVVFPPLGQALAPLPRHSACDTLSQLDINLANSFIFHHGNASWYKNRDLVFTAFVTLARERPDLDLVLSGGDLSDKQLKIIADNYLGERVHALGRVSADVLAALYSLAKVFFFPSWVEGFGWPPIEAQVCGCPVVASNAGSLAEVLGDSALTAHPDDIDAFVHHISEVLDKDELQKELKLRGFKNLKRFTKAKFAQELMCAYGFVVASKPAPSP